jgi:hypothetical protein
VGFGSGEDKITSSFTNLLPFRIMQGEARYMDTRYFALS